MRSSEDDLEGGNGRLTTLEEVRLFIARSAALDFAGRIASRRASSPGGRCRASVRAAGRIRQGSAAAAPDEGDGAVAGAGRACAGCALAHERVLAAHGQNRLHVARLARRAADAARSGGLPPIQSAADDADFPQGGVFGASGGVQPVEPADRRPCPRASAGRSASSTLKLRYGLIRNDSILMALGSPFSGFTLTEATQSAAGATSPRHRPAQCHIYLNQNRGTPGGRPRPCGNRCRPPVSDRSAPCSDLP